MSEFETVVTIYMVLSIGIQVLIFIKLYKKRK